MSLSKEDRQLLREINNNLKRYFMMEQQKKETLIKVTEVKKLTVWENKEQLRMARESGFIAMKKEQGKIFYIKESINPAYLKKAI
jgi:hypothetical protein